MRLYDLAGVTNRWEASRVGHVPTRPSYTFDPPAVLVRLCWGSSARWVPAHANRWNTLFVLVTVTPDPGDRRTEELLWVHHTDVVWELPATPSTAPKPPPRAPGHAELERRHGRL
ncbi:hypothetical protein ACIGB8_28800 [Promicromonospora sukumoe]|uniref:hypothetical protein n=1 Tax=Promicromonospora sukumoe TaxID=88382 RepID=UPI0037C814FE